MAYTDIDFPTKSALIKAVKSGQLITVYNPGNLFSPPTDGIVYLEGPHYPKPHRWYAQAILKNGIIQSVK